MYFPYLNFLINAFAEKKNYTNLSQEVADMLVINDRDELSVKTDYLSGQKRKKGETKGGGPDCVDCVIALSDIIGIYGIYMSPTESGFTSSKPVNTLEDIYKLNQMYDEVYSIEIRKEQPPTNVAAGLETGFNTDYQSPYPTAKKSRKESFRVLPPQPFGKNIPTGRGRFQRSPVGAMRQLHGYRNGYPGGGKISRKRRPNKLTRKNQKKIKARKTRHKAKKHRYTRRNKK
jgi:hypothetical protein